MGHRPKDGDEDGAPSVVKARVCVGHPSSVMPGLGQQRAEPGAPNIVVTRATRPDPHLQKEGRYGAPVTRHGCFSNRT